MPEFYLCIVILLFFLAISDLIVGVSNDAVNFLNSAIGSKVAPRRVIMVVASLGIFAGAIFSSGMMEVARKGIFNPEFFFFGEITIIFLAVMITDIILLDFFNTIGMPTSTTVSIVFELLGAAVVISLVKISAAGEGFSDLGNYINTTKAMQIIGGIFISVFFAFLTGVIVQYISRLIFSFHYQKRQPFIAALWSGIAMAAMTYFLLFKGIKGASFATDEFLTWIKEHMMLLFGGAFVFWTLVMQILAMRKINVFRIVVLFGTFSLAMAFAGNDLVNFIGVPIAGFESYLNWSSTGQDAFSYSMEVLKEPVRTKTYLLVIAGLIMVVTLWLSKKARSVTDTEVNLGRQSEGHERFSPNLLSQSIVRGATAAASFAQSILPTNWLSQAGKQFVALPEEPGDQPAFDLIRASVNLTTASVLIALATSLKLPLSTTYVSFMVAMGTSLADRAWGRDSAVYRVAGVLQVIGGWFATALIAFTVSGIFALLIFYFRTPAIVLLVALALFLLYRSSIYHKRKEKQKETRLAFEQSVEAVSFDKLLTGLSGRIEGLLQILEKTYDKTLHGLAQEDRKVLNEAEKYVEELKARNEDLQYELYGSIKRVEEKDTAGAQLYLQVFDLEQDMVQSMELIVRACGQHVDNSLSPLHASQAVQIEGIRQEVGAYLQNTRQFILQNNEQGAAILQQKTVLLQLLESTLREQINGIKANKFGARNSQLIFKLLLESKDLVAVAARFIKLYQGLPKS